MKAGLLALLALLAACARGVAPGAMPPAPVPAVPTAEPTPAPSPAPPRSPVAPPALALQLGLMPLSVTRVPDWRQAHPTADGRGVLIAILDSGVDLGVLGLQTTTTGDLKVLDLRNFSSEGVVALEPVRVAGDGSMMLEGGLRLLGVSVVRAVAVDSGWYGGVIRELPFGDLPNADFNGNGSNRDAYAVVVVRGASGWLAFVDTNGDGSLGDETALADFLVRRDTFTFSSRYASRGRGPITGAVNLSDDPVASGRPRLSLFLDTLGHGTHVTGIAAGHDMYGVSGFDGVAPGAQVLGLKIADNARGGLSTTGSMVRAMEYAARFAEERRLPLVINMSFGIGNEDEGGAAMDSLVNAFLATHPDVVFAVSAGNDGPGTSTMGLPATAELALTVGALYPGTFAAVQFGSPGRDVVGWWGSRGGESVKPDVVAPGIAYSTVPRWNTGQEIKRGTSMATPHVAGLVALLRSAMAQERREVTAGDLAQSLRVSAHGFAGETFLDQGFGVPELEAAYRWLSAGHAGRRFRVVAIPAYRTMPTDLPARFRPADRQAAYRRQGLVSARDTVQRFRVRRTDAPTHGRTGAAGTGARADGGTEAYLLRSDAPWLRPAQPTLALGPDGSAEVDLYYDPVLLRRRGRHVGAVYGIPEADTAAGPEFVLLNTIVVPDSLAGGMVAASSRKLPAGQVARYYLPVPPEAAGLSARLTSRDSAAQGTLYLFEPSGRPARGADKTEVGGTGARQGSLTVTANDLVPGVWEAVVLAAPGRELRYDIDAVVPPVRIARVDSVGASVRVAFASTLATDTTLRVSAEQVGIVQQWTAAIERGAIYRRTFSAPAWATVAVVEVQLSRETWDQVTDFGITVFDRDGAQLGNGAMNYAFHRVTAELPAQRRGDFAVAVELFPAFAHVEPPARFDAVIRVAFVGPPVALGGAGAGSGAVVRIPARGEGVAEFAGPTARAPSPEWSELVSVKAEGREHDWVVIERRIAVRPR